MQEGADATIREVQIEGVGVQRVVEEAEIREDADKEVIDAEAVLAEE